MGEIVIIGDGPKCVGCNLHRTRRKIVWGRGSESAIVMIVGEAPGFNEDKRGRPWIGMAGTETRWILQSIGINPARDVFWTNLIKCHPLGDKNPTPEQVSACEHHLIEELLEIAPPYIVTLGAYSTRWFLGDITMERANGIPFETDWGVVVPILHPAAGLRRPEDMVKVRYGFGSLILTLKGDIEPLDPDAMGHLTGNYWLVGPRNDPPVLDGVPEIIAEDTEWAEGKPFCVTVTSRPGQASMVMAGNRHALEHLNLYHHTANCKEIIIHNSAYDLPVLYDMGIEIPTEKLRDSMVAAYLLQSEPQGLKDLTARILRAQMRDYNEVVRPYRFNKAIKYLESVLEYDWPDPEPVLEYKKGEPYVRQPQNITRIVNGILRDVADPIKAADPYLRWRKVRNDKKRSDITLIEYNVGKLYDGDLSDAPADVALEYACSDSNATHQIWPYLRDRIIAEGMWDVFMVDMRMMPMIADMMRFGVKIDPAKLGDLGDLFDDRMEQIRSTIEDITGESINPNSPDMVSGLLYGKLRLGRYITKHMAKKQSSTMTGDAVLARLEDKHPVVKWIREFRKYSKLKSSYVETLPTQIDDDGRVRGTIRVTRTATGRPSMSAPNLLATPTRTEEGRTLREAFIAEIGSGIGESDYSQIEMRLTASESMDKRMMRIFKKGQDIHDQTASWMFGIPINRLDGWKHRYPAKRVGFGVLNDLSAQGLQRELIVGGAEESDWPVDRCQELINSWFDVYKGVAEYMEDNRNYAARYGKIADMWGRIRWVPWAKAKTRWKREAGLRQAGNAPIQSGAQGIMKRAMVKLQPMYVDYRRKLGYRAVPMLQIYDSIVGEYDERIAIEFLGKQKQIMESAAGNKLRVPLIVDVKYGPSWGKAKKIKF